MKRKILIFMVILLVVSSFADPIFGVKQLYRVAVLPFDDRSITNRWWGNEFQVGQEVSSELVTALLNTQQFRMIEREQVDRILNEQKFTNTMGDPKTVIQFGKILGVKYLIMGHVTEFAFDHSQGGAILGPRNLGFGIRSNIARVAIDARMVDTTTAEIFCAVTGVGEKVRRNLGIATGNGAMFLGGDKFSKSDLGQALRDAVNSAANQFAQKVQQSDIDKPLIGLVAYTSPTTVIINIGETSGVEPGMTFGVEHVIQTVKDPVTKEVIDEVSEEVASITVIQVKEKASVCKIISQTGDISVNDKVQSKADTKPDNSPEVVAKPSLTPEAEASPTPTLSPKPTPTPDDDKPKSDSKKNASDWL